MRLTVGPQVYIETFRLSIGRRGSFIRDFELKRRISGGFPSISEVEPLAAIDLDDIDSSTLKAA